MDGNMWQNQIVQSNVAKLAQTGYSFLNPVQGILASGKTGTGRFPPPELTMRKIMTLHKGYKSLGGKKFLVSGGRTEEDIDPVRIITNRSSGRMALELLYAIMCRDGVAKGIFGEVGVSMPGDMDITRVRTSSEMLKQLKRSFKWSDCLVMAAAIGDYKPKKRSSSKIHSDALTVQLTKNVDLLAALSKSKSRQLMVGFSLDEQDHVKKGKKKLAKKGLDLIVLNEPSVLGSDRAKAQIVRKTGKITKVATTSKWQLAHKILDLCLETMNH
jgi:phosphopantothenoylcysteine decarboxylase/phosphopantothenate--cysteine ligase